MIKLLRETTPFPLQKIGELAGICWNSPIYDKERNIQRAKECIISGHGRVLEYVDIEMEISGYSARCIREFYTHIAGSPTRLQESTRYVNCEDFMYYRPEMTEKMSEQYDSTMGYIKSAYAELIKLGMSKEDCANILPLGMYTKIVDKRNLRNLVNLMNQRMCGRAYKEIRQLANDIKSELSKVSDEWQWICAELFVPKCEVTGFCVEKKCCGRKQKKGE